MFFRAAEQQANFSPTETNICVGLATLLRRCRSGHDGFRAQSVDRAPPPFLCTIRGWGPEMASLNWQWVGREGRRVKSALGLRHALTL